MASKKKLWWVGGGLKIVGLKKIRISKTRKQNKNLFEYGLDQENAMYVKAPFSKEDIVNKDVDSYTLKHYIEGLLRDKPDGFYYVHARPPAEWKQLHGLFCVTIAKVKKQGDYYDWDFKHTRATEKYPLKKKGRFRVPRHKRKPYLVHDKRIFPENK